jgi:hypothetical protein
VCHPADHLMVCSALTVEVRCSRFLSVPGDTGMAFSPAKSGLSPALSRNGYASSGDESGRLVVSSTWLTLGGKGGAVGAR